MKNLFRLFKTNKKIALLPHESIDGDAVCSCLALQELAKLCGGSADIIIEDKIPFNLEFLGGEFIMMSNDISLEYDCAVAVDCGDKSRLGTRVPVFEKAPCTGVIDHHVTNTGFGDVCVVNPHACATCEIIFTLFTGNNIAISPRAASYIYGGMLTDTGGFRYSNTTPETLEAAAALMRIGVNASELCDKLLETRTLSQMKIEAAALFAAKYYHDGKTVISHITSKMLEEAGAGDDETGTLSSMLRTIAGVHTAVTLKERDGKLKISMRTNGTVNAAEVCAAFGGGGHARAAGATVTCSAEEITEKILKAADKYERNN